MAERVSDRARRPPMAVAADALTAVRVPLAFGIALVIGLGDAIAAGAILLAVAWLSDVADGRLARRSAGHTALGPWDPIVDALVGLGVLLGLAVAERVMIFPWLPLAAVLLAAFLVTRNLALGMVLQAVAYGLLIVELAVDAPGALWVLGITAAVIGVLDARRLVEVVLPTFFSGLGFSGLGLTGRGFFARWHSRRRPPER